MSLSAAAADKPNILWVTSEDHGPHMGCYGDKLSRTPNIDALAAKGMIFSHAWSCLPVCAPARTTIISGIYAQSSGGEHMRSMVPLPQGARMFPAYLRDAGYFCTNNSKEDYNLAKPSDTWDDSSGKAHWKYRAAGQPFFAVFNSTKSHESQIRTRPHQLVTDPAKVRVPAYHPDTPEVRQDWAQYYDKVSAADADAGKQLQELASAGLADDTIVFYFGDHGSGMPRSKRWPGNSGLHVPMVVHFPPKWQHLAPKEYKPGTQSDRLVSFVDLAPTILSIAGIKPPAIMQGHAFAGMHQTEPQPFIYGSRGRMDERIDLIRSVTDGRFVYLRNFYPHVSQAQHVAYQFETPTTKIWRKLYDDGKASAAQSQFWQTPREPEELYDLQNDPDEVVNLAGRQEHRATLEKFRQAQRKLAARIRDVSFLPEGEIHTRSQGTTPYDMAHNDAKYPFQKIFDAAEMASMPDPSAASKLQVLLKDEDSAVRFWAALGIGMRGQSAVEPARSNLTTALDDGSLFVRIAAAQALAQYGDSNDLKTALAALGELAPPDKNGVLVSIPALNAIDALGKKSEPLGDLIRTMKQQGPSPDGRYNSYVPRLAADITSTLDGSPPLQNKSAKKPKRKS